MLDNFPVGQMSENQLAGIRNSFIGFVFQMHHLLPQLTVFENTMLPVLPLKQNKELLISSSDRAFMLLDRVGLTEHLNKYPSQLSIGECQRTAVVRALINQPKLLLADEPTGSLDAANARQLTELLSELNREQKIALVLVTHSMELALKMDKIYRLHEGKLVIEQ